MCYIRRLESTRSQGDYTVDFSTSRPRHSQYFNTPCYTIICYNNFLNLAFQLQMLRSLGYIPREADIAALNRVVGDVYNGKLNFTAFVKIMVSLIMPSVSTVEDAIEPVGIGLAKHETLFRHRAADSIALSDLKAWMTQHAPEKLTELEWSSWASTLELKDGRISHGM